MEEYLLIAGCLLLGIACFFLLVMVIDGNRFKVVSYELSSKKLSKEYKFVLLADLHDKCYGEHNQKVIQQIQQFNPDIILIAGDMITVKAGCFYENAIQLCKELAKEYPVYYGMGNHESRLFCRSEDYDYLWEAFEQELLSTGTVLLRNRAEKWKQELAISGLEIDWQYYGHFQTKPMDKTYLTKTLGKAEQKRYQILLAHQPDYFIDYADWGADLVLSGHVHGGIVRLPLLGGVINPALQLFPRYDGGLFQKGDSAMILSRGLGMHTLPVRIFNPGELVLITVKPKKKEEGNGSVR